MPALSRLSCCCTASWLALICLVFAHPSGAEVLPRQLTIAPVFVTAARGPQPLEGLIADVNIHRSVGLLARLNLDEARQFAQ